MYEMFGFFECEGIEVYVQLFIFGIFEDGIIIMQMIKDFDEGFIWFESVYSMSVLLFVLFQIIFCVVIFVKVFVMYFDKFFSWDDM